MAILLAGGQGVRAGGPKQYRRARGKSLLEWACRPFVREKMGIIVVGPADSLTRCERLARKACGDRLLAVVAGGATRHQSSRAGLAALPDSCRHVLIHDVARPSASEALVRRVLRAARKYKAAIPALLARDSLVEARGDKLREYLARERIYTVQTPQAFARATIEAAFRQLKRSRVAFTDDASVLRAVGTSVRIVEGEEGNQKLTSAADWKRFARGS